MSKVIISYCPACGWLLRSSWYAQELLNTFKDELDEVTLKIAGSGEFSIVVNDELIWERKRDKGFPEIKWLKNKIRDVVAPEKSLGHAELTKK